MGACAGKHKRNDNESNRRPTRRNPVLRCCISFKREEHQRLLNETTSSTTLYDLPLEMLDIILQKSYLLWIFNLSTNQRDEEVIRSLISVDVCFNRRITRQRFKKAIWRYLNDIYGKTKKRSAIIRNNRNYFLENIQPNDELIASLLSLNCITEKQCHLIQRQRLSRDKNDEILYIVESFDEAKFSDFVKCLRQTNQKTVARIMENGGEVIKVDVQDRGAKCLMSMETQLLHETIEDLRNRTKPRSHHTDKLISQLKDEGIEILNSQLVRRTVVVWIWCHAQAALEHIQWLYESYQLRDVVFENIQPYSSKTINIDRNQFQRTAVICTISINFTQRIEIRANEDVYGVTKLRNKIYVLCLSYSSSLSSQTSSPSSPNVIRVFEDLSPFNLQMEVEIKEMRYAFDIGSSEKENCLYVSDYDEKCVWKITRETNAQHNIMKWLTTDYNPHTLSVNNDGHLLMINDSSSILMIYGSDAELIRSIQLPRNIGYSIHAVETSTGNFIILHRWMENEKKGQRTERRRATKWGICEVTRDEQMVIRRFITSNKTHQLNDPRYLALDSDDHVFVADTRNFYGTIILLDSDLKWNRILCPTKEETRSRWFVRLRYDKDKEQLIVGGYLTVNVYTLSRN